MFLLIGTFSYSQNSNAKDFVYRLYPTENVYNFLKLNTRNGQINQVQFSFEESNRGETVLSNISLVSKEEEINGRFTLYPTKNAWTFILLDQVDGHTWQVQWSLKSENKAIVPITILEVK